MLWLYVHLLFVYLNVCCLSIHLKLVYLKTAKRFVTQKVPCGSPGTTYFFKLKW